MSTTKKQTKDLQGETNSECEIAVSPPRRRPRRNSARIAEEKIKTPSKTPRSSKKEPKSVTKKVLDILVEDKITEETEEICPSLPVIIDEDKIDESVSESNSQITPLQTVSKMSFLKSIIKSAKQQNKDTIELKDPDIIDTSNIISINLDADTKSVTPAKQKEIQNPITMQKFKLDRSKYMKMLNKDNSQDATLKFTFLKYLQEDSQAEDVHILDNATVINASDDKAANTSLKTEIHSGDTKSEAEKLEIAKVLKKSVLKDNLEKLETAPKTESKNSKKLKQKKDAEETAGAGWYNLPKTEVTDAIKNDLQIIKMRGALNTKQHYKRNDSNKLPKYFQIGTIVEGAHEYYTARVPKKMRKQTMADELLADAEFRSKNKKRFVELQRKNMKASKKYYRPKNRK